MTYKRFGYRAGNWDGILNESGWAEFRRTDGVFACASISMKAVAASQEAAEDYVRRKTESLARGEPSNKYLEIKQV